MATAAQPPVHFVCVFGPTDPVLLPHVVDHYRSLGVDSFRVIRHAESTSDPGYVRLEELARQAGVPLFHSHVSSWNLNLQQRLFRYAMEEDPDDWFVVADADEFQVYDRPLRSLIDHCERGGYDYVSGCFLDRLAPDGGFPPIGPGSLWEQFPMAGSLSASLLSALPMKVCLARGRVELLTGQHGAPLARELPHTEGFAQVNHFKWTDGIVPELAERVSAYDDGTRRDIHPSMVRESRRFLSHISRRDGRVDLADPRLRFHRGGSDYGAHPEWEAIVREAESWRWTQR
jgi:hypothetical protein